MKVWGQGMPPRNPAAEARAASRRRARAVLLYHLRGQLWGVVDTLFEVARISGVVLLVLKILSIAAPPTWLAVALCVAPNIGTIVATLGAFAWARFVRWRVDREVR